MPFVVVDVGGVLEMFVGLVPVGDDIVTGKLKKNRYRHHTPKLL